MPWKGKVFGSKEERNKVSEDASNSGKMPNPPLMPKKNAFLSLNSTK
jgi:hypothetical protein